jgi:hypothetical protein
VKNISIQNSSGLSIKRRDFFSDGVSSGQKRRTEEDAEDDTAHCASDGIKQSEQDFASQTGKNRGRATFFDDVTSINTKGMRSEPPLPNQESRRDRKRGWG